MQNKVWNGLFNRKYYLINTIPLWNLFCKELSKQKIVALDTETNGIHWINSNIIGVSVCWGFDAYYVPVRHVQLDRCGGTDKKPLYKEKVSYEKQLEAATVFEFFRNYLDNKDLVTIWHNAKFDLHFFKNEDVNVSGKVHDTMLMHNLLDENVSSKLKELSTLLLSPRADKWEKSLDEYRTKFARQFKIPKNSVHYGLLPLEIVSPYAAADTQYTWALYNKFIEQLEADNELFKIYTTIEIPLMFELINMERFGMCVDRKYFSKISPEMGDELIKLEKEFFNKLGCRINLNSTKQLVEALKKKGVKFTKLTKNKTNYALDSDVLEKLAVKYDLCADLLKYRKLTKLKTTYVDSILEKSEFDEHVHCEFNQNVVTGRMCVGEGSLVKVCFGKNPVDIPIEQVSAGYFVYSTDKQGKISAKRVNWSGITGTKKTLELVIADGLIDIKVIRKLRLTPEHEVMLFSGKWVQVSDLRRGDQVATYGYNNYKKSVKRSFVEAINEGPLIPVYNLEVEENNNFFAEDLCVHNSGKNPNLMNIPGKDETVREGFISPVEFYCRYCSLYFYRSQHFTGVCPVCGNSDLDFDSNFLMLLVDLSQIEVRLTAHASQDPILLRVYQEGVEDVHTRTLCEIFDRDYVEVANVLNNDSHEDYKELNQQRKIAKRVNFLIIYGGGGYTLAAGISTSDRVYTETECEGFINTYFKKYVGVKNWIDRTRAELRRNHFVKNFFGRCRRLPKLKNAPLMCLTPRGKAEIEHMLRMGLNFIIQSSAAELFKILIIRMGKLFQGTRSRLVNPIHDEIIFYLHKSDIKLLPKIKSKMEDWNFTVPIVADFSVSLTSWAKKRKLKA